ncbi:hypothetical protein CV014_28935, partial [Nostoc sp. CMAA1605]|nr:hypothetical protein [Nostoc sp. CMAA1605]
TYPTNYIFDMSGSTDSRKKLFVRFGGTYAVAPNYDNVFTAVSLGAASASAINSRWTCKQIPAMKKTSWGMRLYANQTAIRLWAFAITANSPRYCPVSTTLHHA